MGPKQKSQALTGASSVSFPHSRHSRDVAKDIGGLSLAKGWRAAEWRPGG